MTKKQQCQFNKDVVKYLKELNAKPLYHNSLIIWYEIETVCGTLRIGLDEPERSEIFSIYCRFQDEKEAAKYLQHGYYGRLNEHSGKWNWHGRDAERLLNAFQIDLSPLLLTQLQTTN